MKLIGALRPSAALLLLSALLPGCGGGAKQRPPTSTAAPPPPSRVRVTTEEAAGAAVGKPVTVEGRAENAKLGAAVVSGALVVYCLDRASWAADQVGRPVAVDGVLEKTDEFTAPDGPVHAAGTGGPVFVLRHSTLNPGAAPQP